MCLYVCVFVCVLVYVCVHLVYRVVCCMSLEVTCWPYVTCIITIDTIILTNYTNDAYIFGHLPAPRAHCGGHALYVCLEGVVEDAALALVQALADAALRHLKPIKPILVVG
jgi:hypothetical protein